MSVDRHGAMRAAVLLNLLVESSAPIPYRSFESRLPWILDDVPLRRSFEQLRRRAVDVLRRWGVDVIDDGRTLRLDRSAPSPAPLQRLPISADQAQLRDRIASFLRRLDPRHRVDETAVLKVHVPRDRLAITYGLDAKEYQGVPYGYVADDRPRLLVRTDQGDLAFWADAILSVSLIAPNYEFVGDGDRDAPLVPAEPVRGVWRNQPGRPPDVGKLRQAQRVAAAVRSAAPPSVDDADELAGPISYSTIAKMTGFRTEDVQSLATIVYEIDRAVVPDEDSFVVYPSRGATILDGARALVARLELAAVRALGGAHAKLDSALHADELGAWERLLDEFLSHADIPDPINDDTPCAADIVAALADSDTQPFEVVVDTSGSPRHSMLSVEGLTWHQFRWWVIGHLDDQIVTVGELPLAAIRSVHVPSRDAAIGTKRDE